MEIMAEIAWDDDTRMIHAMEKITGCADGEDIN